MRERLAAALYPHMARSLDFNGEGFDDFDTAGPDDGWVQLTYEAVDALLAELATPDEGMIEAATQSPASRFLAKGIFTAMIEAIK